MKHDLDATPVRVHRIETGQVVDRVQSAFVLVETWGQHVTSYHNHIIKNTVRVHTFKTNFVANDLQKFVKERTVFVVIQNLLFGVLAVFDVDDAHFQLRFNEYLQSTYTHFDLYFGRVDRLIESPQFGKKHP